MIYTIKSGDTLFKIGSKFGVNWKNIAADNKAVIKDPNKIFPGMKIRINLPKSNDSSMILPVVKISSRAAATTNNKTISKKWLYGGIAAAVLALAAGGL